MQSLVQEVKKKNEVLDLAHASLKKVMDAFFQVNKALDSSHMMLEELKASLKEGLKGYKKTKDNLRGTCLENISFAKDYAKVVEDSLFA